MSAWNFMSYESKENLLDAIRRESDGMFALAEDPGCWEAPTGAGHWQVRDVFGHLIDTTETYFVGFDAARGDGEGPPLVPLTEMSVHVDSGAQAFRSLGREEALERLGVALDKMFEIESSLAEEDWAMLVPHKYMGPLPAFFSSGPRRASRGSSSSKRLLRLRSPSVRRGPRTPARRPPCATATCGRSARRRRADRPGRFPPPPETPRRATSPPRLPPAPSRRRRGRREAGTAAATRAAPP